MLQPLLEILLVKECDRAGFARGVLNMWGAPYKNDVVVHYDRNSGELSRLPWQYQLVSVESAQVLALRDYSAIPPGEVIFGEKNGITKKLLKSFSFLRNSPEDVPEYFLIFPPLDEPRVCNSKEEALRYAMGSKHLLSYTPPSKNMLVGHLLRLTAEDDVDAAFRQSIYSVVEALQELCDSGASTNRPVHLHAIYYDETFGAQIDLTRTRIRPKREEVMPATRMVVGLFATQLANVLEGRLSETTIGALDKFVERCILDADFNDPEEIKEHPFFLSLESSC